MTIHPPKVIVDEKEPFKGALFGREEFGKSLVSILRNVSDNLVIFVNAPWGAGKTTFSKMWLAHLRTQQKLEVIYYDAYAADHFDDPFVSFSGEILEFVDKKIRDGKDLKERKEFKKTAVEVGKKISGLAVKIGLRAITLGAIEPSQVDELNDIASEIANGVSEIGGDIIEKKIENYAAEKDALIVFKKSLAKLAKKVQEKQGFPLTIIVDELDRCRPDFALRLLERIKHLFDVEGVAFVLLVNREQIENYIRAVYGEKVDAHAYLLKFGNLFVDLPIQQSRYAQRYQPGRKEYCQSLMAHYGIAERMSDDTYLSICIWIFADHFDLTLREIEKAFAAMTMYYGASPGSHISEPLLVALLSVLKVKQPILYRLLAKQNMSAKHFLEQTGFEKLRELYREEFDSERAVAILNLCLMSEHELDLATNDPNGAATAQTVLRQLQTIRYFGGNRSKIIPALCWHLDRFSLQL